MDKPTFLVFSPAHGQHVKAKGADQAIAKMDALDVRSAVLLDTTNGAQFRLTYWEVENIAIANQKETD